MCLYLPSPDFFTKSTWPSVAGENSSSSISLLDRITSCFLPLRNLVFSTVNSKRKMTEEMLLDLDLDTSIASGHLERSVVCVYVEIVGIKD